MWAVKLGPCTGSHRLGRFAAGRGLRLSRGCGPILVGSTTMLRGSVVGEGKRGGLGQDSDNTRETCQVQDSRQV